MLNYKTHFVITLFCLFAHNGRFHQSIFAAADGHERTLSDVCCHCGAKQVTPATQIPEMKTEKRVVTVVECRIETHERTIMVKKLVPETRPVRDVHVEMVPRIEKRMEKVQVCDPAWETVTRDVTVQVPEVQVRKETRRVCRLVQVEEILTVPCDIGYWNAPSAVPYAFGGWADVGIHGGWSHAWRYGHFRRAFGYGAGFGFPYYAGRIPLAPGYSPWDCQPNVLTQQVPVTAWREEVVEEPFEYQVTVYHPEIRKQTVKVYKPVVRTEEREVEITVRVPKSRVAVRNVTTYRTVLEPQVERYAVRVPHTVQKVIEFPVCRCQKCGERNFDRRD